MKKLISIFLLSFAILASSFSFADARSGCCSHHGGVCTCKCCDGTSLSATCAPYYPSCSKPVMVTKPVATPTVSVPTKTKISEFNQALAYVKTQQTAYTKNSTGFREKLFTEMTGKYKNLNSEIIALVIYSQLQ